MPRKVRGTLTIKDCDDMEFRAYRSTGISSQEAIASCGDSKLYRTVGEKKKKIIAHVVLPEDSSDLRADLYEKVDKLTASLQTKAKPRLRGRSLLKEPDVAVTANEKEHSVQVILDIDVSTYPDYTSRLLTLMQRVNQCFATNQISLAKLRK